LDAGAAEAVPGVLAVLTHLNAPTLPYLPHKGFIDPAVGERLHVLQDDAVRFNGQPVAVVVAETIGQAEHAATLLRLTYADGPAALDCAGRLDQGLPPGPPQPDGDHDPGVYERGAPDDALAAADVRVDHQYWTARENHNPMEPHATVARWDGERLTLWDKNQWV